MSLSPIKSVLFGSILMLGFAIPSSSQTAGTAAASSAVSAAPTKRVAVLNFDYATVRTQVTEIFGSDQDIGKGISELLVQKLVQDGKFRVIERSALDKVIAEQNLSNSDRADATTAAKIGKVLGVDAIITGSITQFGRDDQHTNVGGGGHNTPWSGGMGKLGLSKSKAVVVVSARVIDANTGEILAAVSGTGESTRSGTSVGGGGGSWWKGGGGGLDMGSSNFGATIIGEATHKAVDDTGEKLDASSNKVPTTTVQVNGLVADVSGNTLIFNVGTKAGIHVGDKLVITRAVRQIKDPATGKVIKSVEDKIGEATVTETDSDSATATFTGAGAPKVGDTVKTP